MRRIRSGKRDQPNRAQPPSTEKSRDNLTTEIRIGLRTLGLSLADAAENIGVPKATFRTWLERRKLPQTAMVRLSRLLGWSDDKLREWTEEETITWTREIRPAEPRVLTQVFAQLDKQCGSISDSLRSKQLDMVCRCIRSMRKGDIYAFTSFTVIPLEFQEEHWAPVGEVIAEAIFNGGKFLYVWPSGGALEKYRNKWGGWARHKTHEPDEFYNDVLHFRTNVAVYLESTGRSLTTEAIAEQTPQAFCDRSPFWAPGFALGMFRTTDYKGGAVLRRMTVRVPTNTFGVLYISEDRKDLFQWRFEQFLREALKMKQQYLSNEELVNLKKVSDLLDKEFLAE